MITLPEKLAIVEDHPAAVRHDRAAFMRLLKIYRREYPGIHVSETCPSCIPKVLKQFKNLIENWTS